MANSYYLRERATRSRKCTPHFHSPPARLTITRSSATAKRPRWWAGTAQSIGSAGRVSIPERVSRRYRPNTLILETEFATPEGEAVLIDFMPLREHASHVMRLVVGKRGSIR